MSGTVPAARPTIVGPDNCPKCKAQARADEYRTIIDEHRDYDPTQPRGRRLCRCEGRCELHWSRGYDVIVRESLARQAAATREHHCQPHRCDFGRNCGSYVGPYG